jgi:hypothetical protein
MLETADVQRVLIIKLISKVVVSEMAKEVFLMRRRKYIS